MTATKQSKESSEIDKNSTRSDLSEIQVKISTLSSTSTTSNMSANPCLDVKLEHFFTYYFLPKGPKHEIRLIFTKIDFYDFEEFISIDKQGLLEMRQKKGNTMATFNDQKIILIHDVVLYYSCGIVIMKFWQKTLLSG